MAYNIAILDPTEWAWGFGGQSPNTTTLKTVEAWRKFYGADLAWNLGVFDMKTGASYAFVAGSGVLCDPSGETDPKIGGASDVLKFDSINRCKGYSNGIVNGVVKINKPMGGSAVRNGIGVTANGKAIVAQGTTKTTETAFCNAVKAYAQNRGESIKLFVLQDGGGSTSEASGFSNLGWYATGEKRAVATVFWAKRKTPVAFRYDLYKNCPYKEDVMLWQLVTGGLEIDGSFGAMSIKRAELMQSALGVPSGLRKGIVGMTTFKAMGCSVK